MDRNFAPYAEIIGGRHQADSEIGEPHTIDDNPRRGGRIAVGQPTGKRQPVGGQILVRQVVKKFGNTAAYRLAGRLPATTLENTRRSNMLFFPIAKIQDRVTFRPSLQLMEGTLGM